MSEREYRMRRIGAACRSFALTKPDRIDIANVLLNRHVTSYRELSVDELRLMDFAFNGAVLVAHTLMERRARTRQLHSSIGAVAPPSTEGAS